MEQITKNFKLICGVLMLVCCLLPFASASASIGGLTVSSSLSGFNFFSVGFLGLIGILLIVIGAAALIYIGVVKKDMILASKFSLSYCAKIACLAGCVLCVVYDLTTSGFGIGIGLILCLVFALCAFFEGKVISAIDKK